MTLREAYALLGGNLEAALSRLGDRALLVKHLRKYPEDGTLRGLQEAVAARDSAALRHAAHSIRGTYRTLGLERAADAALRVMGARNWPEREATAQRLTWEHERALEVIGLLEESDRTMAMLIHELRTPLQAILGTAEAEGLPRVAASAKHMSAILSGLGGPSRREPFSLPALLRETVEMLRGVCGGRSAAVRAHLRYEWVLGDPVGLTQALLNLLTNAVRDGEEGSVILEATEAEGATLLTVRDHGRGMTEAERQRACEPYWRARPGPGMGLGLTVVRELTRNMGGEMRMESAPGEGTAVTLRLPLPPAEEAGEENAGRRRFRGLRALLAEDDRLNAEISAELLAGLGLRTNVARDGHEAALLAESGGYDCVFMDAHMPGPDGAQTVKKIRRALPDAPVFALTGGMLPGEEERLREAGVRACLLKPVSREALARLLGEWFPEG